MTDEERLEREAEYTDDLIYQAGLTGVQVEHRPDLSQSQEESDGTDS